MQRVSKIENIKARISMIEFEIKRIESGERMKDYENLLAAQKKDFEEQLLYYKDILSKEEDL